MSRTSGVRPMVSALSANQRGAWDGACVMAISVLRSDSAAVAEVDPAVGGPGFGVQHAQVAPSAGAGVLAGADRRRARVAPDARVARVVQRVTDEAVLGDVRAHVVTAPVV